MSNNRDEDFYTVEDHQDNHIDEKWLISYADMMTLLFGFFVMMYILSANNKAKMEEALQKISKEGFLSDEKTSQSPDDILIEFKIKKEMKRRQELEAELVQAKEMAVKNEEELRLAQEKLKAINDAKIDFKESEEVKILKSSLINLESNLKIINEKFKELTKENESLKKKLSDSPQIEEDNHFMMVFVQWDTEKHDIDMIVEDPSGNIFNYKKRSLASVPGEFVVDSTYGPGVESWVTKKTMEGIYKVTFKFYNQYGNKKDAIIKPSIFNNLKVEKLPQITLNFSQIREKTIFIAVAKDGQFTVSE